MHGKQHIKIRIILILLDLMSGISLIKGMEKVKVTGAVSTVGFCRDIVRDVETVVGNVGELMEATKEVVVTMSVEDRYEFVVHFRMEKLVSRP